MRRLLLAAGAAALVLIHGPWSSAATAQTAGTPEPVIRNSPDTKCDFGRQCTAEEFVVVVRDLRRQWSILPEWITSACRAATTFPTAQNCILHTTAGWLNANPGAAAPWINPANWPPAPPR